MGRPKGSPGNKLNLTGHKYHRLSVLEEAQGRYGKAFWKCLCDCGNNTIVSTSDLRTGNTKSCGCWGLEERTIRAKSKDRNMIRLRDSLNAMKLTAKKKGRTWTLSDQEAYALMQSNCHYCNSEPSNERKDYTYEESTKYSGIDRIDNEQGYTKENCVPCCKMCNFLKKDYDQKFFLNHIRKMTYNLDSKKFDLLSLIKDPSLVQELNQWH